MFSGCGIISGGAIGVDYFVTSEALKINPSAKKIKVFLPTTIDIYAAHYWKRAREGVITKKEAKNLIAQLLKIKKINRSSLVEDKKNIVVSTDNYYKRNTTIIENADQLIAFHINQSPGTKDSIDKAKKKGIFTKVFNYVSKPKH